MHVLIINTGSSSIKYHLYNMELEQLLISGKIERIGDPDSIDVFRRHNVSGIVEEKVENNDILNHAAGIKRIFDLLKSKKLIETLHAIGHRVVHGGETFLSPTLINKNVIDTIRELSSLAPLHNPANLAAIEMMHQYFPQLPQVAVFDTAFFHTLPPHAYRYALPDDLYKQHHVRRYGFHGTSHQYVAKQTAEFLQQPLESLKMITLHLGGGASAAAIQNGICIDTSMGMTPLEGLIMGTRCGDLDPSVHFYLHKKLNMSIDEIENMLNQDSGMKGLCDVSDMREVHRLANSGNERARLAIDMYCYRICKYIGAYYTILGGIDALVFTAGIGENDPLIRQTICNQLSVLGITIDPILNQNSGDQVQRINNKKSLVNILVAATQEELEIARQTVMLVN